LSRRRAAFGLMERQRQANKNIPNRGYRATALLLERQSGLSGVGCEKIVCGLARFVVRALSREI